MNGQMAEEKPEVYRRPLTICRRSLVGDCLKKLLVRRVSCSPGALSASVGIFSLVMKHCSLRPYSI